MKQKIFYDNFNRATHWFAIVITGIEGPLKLTAGYLSSELISFDCIRPVIIQWESVDSSQCLIFFRQSNEDHFQLLTINVEKSLAQEELISHGNFEFPLILEVLGSGLGGSFRGNLLDITLDVKQEFDMWRFIDYATRSNDCLSLRFLMLFNWDLTQKNQDGSNILEIAAENGNPKTISALLNLPITLDSKNVLSEEQKKLLTVSDAGKAPLMIVVEKGRASTLKFLIECGVDINCPYTLQGQHSTLIDLAWNSQRYDNVLTLLQADSFYPSEYNLSDIEELEEAAALKKFVEEVAQFHQALQENDRDNIERFCECYPRLKTVYDRNNQSSLMIALEARRYEAFVLLQLKGFTTGQNEDLVLAYQALNPQEKEELKLVKLKYFQKQDNAHIIFLLAKSKIYDGNTLRNASENYSAIIQELFEQLDNIPEMSVIMKVLEQAEFIQITFCFDNKSSTTINRLQSAITYNYKTGYLYIEVKESRQALSSLAQGLTQLAIQTVYMNNSKPYTSADKWNERVFKEIVDVCHKRSKVVDPIIGEIFNNCTNVNDWPSELIVCVPLLLVRYGKRALKMKECVSELFAFYENHVQKDFLIFIKEYTRIRCEYKIQSLNDLLGELDKIQQSKIWLKEHLCNFDMFYSCNIIVLVVNSPDLAKSDLYQTLSSKRSLQDIKTHYIFATVNQFENRNQAKEIYNIHQSTTKPVLIVDCTCDDNSSYENLQVIIDNFAEKRRIILIMKQPPREENTKTYQMFTLKKYYTWKDVRMDSQTFILHKSVDFQGHNITLQELGMTDVFITESVPLEILIEKQKIKIGESLPTSFSFDKSCYIPRTFISPLLIEDRILTDKMQDIFPDQLAYSKMEFHKLCREYPNSIIHWLSKETSGELIWQQSRGSTINLNQYIAVKNKRSYRPENMEDLLKQARRQKIIIISDIAGMGKTTILTHLSREIKRIFPTYWVCFLRLNLYTEELEKQSKKRMDALQFLTEELLKLSSTFERALFKYLVNMKRVVLMLDGFDEISPLYDVIATRLVVELKNTSVEQLWITTRPHLQVYLAPKLEQLCYCLEPFSQEDQLNFLVRFWREKTEISMKNESRMRLYAKALLDNLSGSMNDRGKLFAGIPLQTRLLAEAFLQEFEDFYSSKEDTISDLPNQLDIVNAYTRFLRSKYQIYVKEKGKPPNVTVATKDLLSILKGANLRKLHQQLALEILFPRDKESLLKPKKLHRLLQEQISRIEYYVADFFVTKLVNPTSNSTYTQQFLLKRILLQENLQTVRIFFDGLLSNVSCPLQQNTMLDYGNLIKESWKKKNRNTVLYVAVEEKNISIINFLLDCLKTLKCTKTLASLLLYSTNYSQNLQRCSAMYQAVIDGSSNIINILRLWATEAQFNSLQFSQFFMAQDDARITLWHEISRKGYVDVFEQLYKWASKIMHSNFLKEIFCHRDIFFKTVWHYAVSNANFEILEQFWLKARQIKLEPEKVREILLHLDNKGQSLWHYAVADKNQHLLMLQKLMEWAKEVHLNLVDLKPLFCNADIEGQTLLELTGTSARAVKLDKIWEIAKEIRLSEEELKHMLLNKNNNEQTICMTIIKHEDALHKVWLWAKELQFSDEELKQLFFSSDVYGTNVWMAAAKEASSHTLDTLWIIAQEIHLTTEEIKRMLLLTNRFFENTWYMAIKRGQIEIVEKLWTCFKTIGFTKNDIKKIILQKSNTHVNSLGLLTRANGVQMLRKLLQLLEDVFTVKEISNILMTNDNQSEVLWHIASIKGRTEVLNTILEWCSNKLDTDMLTNFSKAKVIYEETMSLVPMWKEQSLERVLKWCEGNLPLNEFKNAILGKQLLGKYVWKLEWRRERILIENILFWCRQNLTLKEIDIVITNEDIFGQTLQGIMIEEECLEIFINLWNWNTDVEVRTYFKKILFRATSIRANDTALQYAMRKRNINILTKIWNWANLMRFTNEDLVELAFTRDAESKSFLHTAVCSHMKDETRFFEEVVDNTKTILERKHLKNLLLIKDHDNQNILHSMAYLKRTDELLQLLQWCIKNFTPDEFQELLLDRCHGEATILHMLAKLEVEGWFRVIEWLEKNLDADVFRTILVAVDDRHKTSIRRAEMQAAIGFRKGQISEEMLKKIGSIEQKCNPNTKILYIADR
ncbi:hypothetical protein Trydic_g18323 [Trypoxylus dichotomus]